MWPQIPQAFQTYRLGQLSRSLWFAHHLTAPLWFMWLLQYLLILWAVNLGSGKDLLSVVNIGNVETPINTVTACCSHELAAMAVYVAFAQTLR